MRFSLPRREQILYFIWPLDRILHAFGDRYLSYRSSYSNRMKIRSDSWSVDIFTSRVLEAKMVEESL